METTEKISAKVGDDLVVTCLDGNPKGKLCSISDALGECKVHVKIDGRTHVLHARTEDIVPIPDKEELMLINFGRSEELPDEISSMVEDGIKKVENILKNTTSEDPLEVFLEYSKSLIDEKGNVSPVPCTFIKKGGELAIAMMAAPSSEVVKIIKKIFREQEPSEITFALPAENKAGSGIPLKFTKMLLIYHHKNDKWVTGILPHGKKGEEIGEVIWNEKDDMWSKRMMTHLEEAGLVSPKPGEPIKSKGTAYMEKINIEEYKEDHTGYFYEGSINEDKLDPKVLEYIKKNKLDINDKIPVTEFFMKKGYRLQVNSKEGNFYSMRITNKKGFEKQVMKRRSLTRAFLESVEIIIENENKEG